MRVHSSLPKMSASDKVSYLIGSLPTPKCNPAKKGKAFPMVEPRFPPFPDPTEIWRGSGMLEGTRVPEGTASCNARPSLSIYDL